MKSAPPSSPPETIHILLIEDDEIDQMAFQRWVNEFETTYSYIGVKTIAQAQQILADNNSPENWCDIIIADYMLPDGTAMDIIPYATDIPLIVVTGRGDEMIAVNALKAGAYDYVVKDSDREYFELLPYVIHNTLAYHRAEKAHHLAKQKLSLIFEASPDAIIINRLTDGQIIDFNERFLELIGHAHDEVLHKSSLELDIWQDTQEREPFMELLMAEGFVHNFQFTYHRHDGQVIYIIISSQIIDFDNQQCILSVLRDITPRVEIEQEREELIAELDAFAHTVAHDLKNPLSTIIGYAQILVEARDNQQDIEKYSQIIVGQSSRMSSIIDELLRFASLNRTDDIASTELDMGQIIFEAKQRLAWLVDDYDAKIVEPNNWNSAIGYAPWIEEVWTNYISNGIKYGGSPPLLELGCDTQPNHMVRFWVKDNGHGLTLEDQTKIFNEFSRLNLRVKGHGLGLSIVKRIVERLGGTVGVESQVDQGSLFYFTLPQQL